MVARSRGGLADIADRTVTVETHYAQYLPLAKALPANEVKPFRVDIGIATHNAARGAEAVLARETSLAGLPGLDLDAVRALGDLGNALRFAVLETRNFTAEPTHIKEQLVEARRLRRLLLAAAHMLVLSGRLPADSLGNIRKGRGAIDTAGDCVALAALFTKYSPDALTSSSVTGTDLAAAAVIGTRLQRQLRPAGAKRRKDLALVAAADIRDRLWTLFERSWHDHVWRPAAWLLGRAVDRYVPPLHSCRRPKHRAAVLSRSAR